ncbi:uncharacterized protein LOC130409239 isoform X2 [Triplophysa dalaica]|uniref:uncharacterized protein LOC130409239 isoform X2 n=1 Tax=Triplophysa dalaica TaxID=1582913 RepID=UPI0024E02D34|nr:uncharacterized protein LOC130409239 isoform X2 [Triplophysa dalaica]
MEWRFILPVVCVLGILFVSGSTAEDASASTKATATNVKGTNVTTTNATATNTTSTNAPAPNGMTTNPTNSAVTKLDITYSIDQPFKDEYTDLSHPETISLINNITSQIESVYKKRFTNFRRYIIRKFSKGSIKTDGTLEFSDNGTVPTAQDVVNFIVEEVKAGSLNLSIDKKTVSASDSSGVPAEPLFNTSQINVTFSINDNFTDALSILNSTEAKNLTDKITTQFVTVFKRRYANILRMVIWKFRNGSIVTDGTLEFKDNDIVPTAQEVVNVIIDAAKAGSFNLSIDKKTVNASDSSGNSATPIFKTSEINVTFSINDNFTDALSNLSSPAAQNLTNKITTQFVTVFKKRYANILRMVIRKFSNGSIVTDGTLEFSDLETVPKAQDVVNVIIDAAKANSFNLSIDKKTVNASDSSGNSATPIFNTSQINVTFSLTDTFTDALSNMSSPAAINLTNKITTQFVAVFKRRYANILRMVIRKFSNGSIVTEGALEFSDLDPVPKAQDVVNVIIDAAKAGSFNLSIDKQTVNASDSSGNSATPIFKTSEINVKFSIIDTFTEALSNISSPAAKNLTDKITTQFVAVFKRRYANILRMVIRKFSKGSIVTEGALEFSDLDPVPKAQDVVNVIVDAVKANNFNFPVDVKSITATDSSGSATSHGSSTVISSMFTVLCMALASLLLSGVMHQ